ncbi:MAG: fibrobacter succinogenes major paralogous domain-containing protein [Bacteroidales bacterium]|nr:fibrobacter succinogenes major paralogous domain-containing protein [Bacteroidales bacterium]
MKKKQNLFLFFLQGLFLPFFLLFNSYQAEASPQSNQENAPLEGTFECSGAQVSCSENTYSFPAGTSGTAPPAVGGYPNYGCLNSTPCPAWYYMQVSVAGDIIITISQSDNHDVDFICWGPFSSLTDGCANGLTGTCPKPLDPCCSNTTPGCIYPKGNITDCSYSSFAIETCNIMNAQVGEIYILLITNYSTLPGMITFSQTGGTGFTDCDIVTNCSVIAITANSTVCDPGSNTFSVSGNIEFTNAPSTGTLTITDNTAVPPVSQVFNPTFTSPLPYILTNIPCDGLPHLLTAVFSEIPDCSLTHQFTAPESTCAQPLTFTMGPQTFCAGTTGQTISVVPNPGTEEYHFSYNPAQPGVTIVQADPGDPFISISFSSTATSGFIEVYGTNAACPSPGITSQLAVTINPLPEVNFPALNEVCLNNAAFPLSTATPSGGTYSGTGVAGGVFDPANAGIGTHTITYTYTDVNGCTSSATQSIVVNATPVITFNSIPDVCEDIAPFPLLAASPIGGIYTGTGIVAGSFYPATAGVGNHSITYTFTDLNGCTNAMSQNIQVNAVPFVDFSGPVVPASVCQDYPTPSQYQVPADPLTTYTWNIPPPYTGKGTVTPVPGSPHVADVNWTGTGPAQLKLDGVTIHGCQKSKTKDILINPKPLVTLMTCFNLVTIPIAKPFILHGGTPLGPTGVYSGTGVTPVAGEYMFNPAVAGVGTHMITYTYVNNFNCPAKDTKVISIITPPQFQCGNPLFPLKDVRTPTPYKSYNTYWSGTRCWMAQDLSYGNELDPATPQTDNCQPQKYCYASMQGGCTSGGFYQWDEVMQYSDQEGTQGLCPPGWHIPTSIEWQTLIDEVAGKTPGEGIAGSYLLYLTGFNTLFKGIYYLNNKWAFTSGNPSATMFWTSTISGNKAIARGLNTIDPSVSKYESSRANAFTVRCVKD